MVAQVLQFDGQSTSTAGAVKLFVAFELSREKWKLGIGAGDFGARARIVTIEAWNLDEFAEAVSRAKKHFGMSGEVDIWTCYEAGREGFSVHRILTKLGCHNTVVDPASIQVDRRLRRTKTDRIDAEKLLAMLTRSGQGEKPWRTVQVPSIEAEGERHLHRDLEELKVERNAHIARIQSLLLTQGVRIQATISHARLAPTLALKSELPQNLIARLEREVARLELVHAQMKAVEKEQAKRAEEEQAPAVELVRKLSRIGGVGVPSAWVLVMELFGWRKFKNRKQVGAAIGLTPSPYDSGASKRCQGISRTGRSRVRALMVQLAWAWLRYQADSALTHWFRARFASEGKRAKRVGIVALARKLVIAWWRYLERGDVPEGAKLKAA